MTKMRPSVSRRTPKLSRLRWKAGARRIHVRPILLLVVSVSLLAVAPPATSRMDHGGAPLAGVLPVGSHGTPPAGRMGSSSFLPTGPDGTAIPSTTVPAVQPGVGWVNITSDLAGQPRARSNASASWDAADGECLLFGGESGGIALGDTWAFKGGSWSQIQSLKNPAPRFGAGLAYDARDQYTVLFGGNNSTGTLNDTWAFSNGQWTRLAPNAPPKGRDFPAMQYDPVAGQVVMFGGYIWDGQQSASTWGFAAGNWTLLGLGGWHQPPDRVAGSIAFDSAAQQLMMFGGWDPITKTPIALNDTWKFVWNGSNNSGNWTQFNTSTHPSPRFDAAVAYDSSEQKVVLFGGSSMAGAALNDTWLWDSTQWAPAVLPADNLSPSVRVGATMAPSPSPGSSPVAGAAIFLFSGAGRDGALVADAWFFGNLSVSVFPPRITPSSLDQNVTVHISAKVFGGDSTSYSYVWTSLPPGCASTDRPTLSCAPTVPGSFAVSVSVTDASGNLAQSLTSLLTVNYLPTISVFTVVPSPSVVSEQVSVTVAATGGTAPFFYQFAGLPQGCLANGSAAFQCYPQSTGTYKIVATVTDADGKSANSSTFLTVNPAGSSTTASWQYAVEGLVLVAIVIVTAVLLRWKLRSRGRTSQGKASTAAITPPQTASESVAGPPVTLNAPAETNASGPPAKP